MQCNHWCAACLLAPFFLFVFLSPHQDLRYKSWASEHTHVVAYIGLSCVHRVSPCLFHIPLDMGLFFLFSGFLNTTSVMYSPPFPKATVTVSCFLCPYGQSHLHLTFRISAQVYVYAVNLISSGFYPIKINETRLPIHKCTSFFTQYLVTTVE